MFICSNLLEALDPLTPLPNPIFSFLMHQDVFDTTSGPFVTKAFDQSLKITKLLKTCPLFCLHSAMMNDDQKLSSCIMQTDCRWFISLVFS